MPGPRIRATHTVAELEVSKAVFDEIQAKLEEAGYQHTFSYSEEGGVEMIDMTGIGLTIEGD
jgi:hypothetical protein